MGNVKCVVYSSVSKDISIIGILNAPIHLILIMGLKTFSCSVLAAIEKSIIIDYSLKHNEANNEKINNDLKCG